MGAFRATRGLPVVRGRRGGRVPGGGVGFWPPGPTGGDAPMMIGATMDVTVGVTMGAAIGAKNVEWPRR